MKTCCCPVCGTGLSGCLAPPPPFPGKCHNQAHFQEKVWFPHNSVLSVFASVQLSSAFLHTFKLERESVWMQVLATLQHSWKGRPKPPQKWSCNTGDLTVSPAWPVLHPRVKLHQNKDLVTAKYVRWLQTSTHLVGWEKVEVIWRVGDHISLSWSIWPCTVVPEPEQT